MSNQEVKPDMHAGNEDSVSRRSILAAAVAAPALISIMGSTAHAQTPAQASRSAIVTGSSRGIGAATARKLALDGYRVTVNCVVNRDLAAEVVRDIEASGGTAIWEQADVSDPVAVRRLFEAHQKAFGSPDVVVANAGIQRLGAFAQMDDADFDRLMDVNVKGVFNTLREASRQVRDGGRIIALASGTTSLRPPTYGAYAASKAAVGIYVNILAKELAGKQISVNAVAPGTTDTTLFTDGKTPEQIVAFAKQTPHRRLGKPDDIANVISILCAERGAWINGQVINANGGLV